ncbi:hypothetical protein [Clostridium sp. DL1XJH146]
MAAVIIVIPIFIVLIIDVPFNSFFSNIFIGISLVLLIIGKFIAFLKKEKGDKNRPADFGIIIALLIIFISRITK